MLLLKKINEILYFAIKILFHIKSITYMPTPYRIAFARLIEP